MTYYNIPEKKPHVHAEIEIEGIDDDKRIVLDAIGE